METPSIRELRRPRLECHRIPNKSCEMLIVEPSSRLLISLDSNSNAVIASAGLAVCFVRVVMPSDVSASDHEDVSLLERCPLPFQRLLNFVDWNFMS